MMAIKRAYAVVYEPETRRQLADGTQLLCTDCCALECVDDAVAIGRIQRNQIALHRI